MSPIPPVKANLSFLLAGIPLPIPEYKQEFSRLLFGLAKEADSASFFNSRKDMELLILSADKVGAEHFLAECIAHIFECEIHNMEDILNICYRLKIILGLAKKNGFVIEHQKLFTVIYYYMIRDEGKMDSLFKETPNLNQELNSPHITENKPFLLSLTKGLNSGMPFSALSISTFISTGFSRPNPFSPYLPQSFSPLIPENRQSVFKYLFVLTECDNNNVFWFKEAVLTLGKREAEFFLAECIVRLFECNIDKIENIWNTRFRLGAVLEVANDYNLSFDNQNLFTLIYYYMKSKEKKMARLIEKNFCLIKELDTYHVNKEEFFLRSLINGIKSGVPFNTLPFSAFISK